MDRKDTLLLVANAVFVVLTEDSLVHSNVCFAGDKPFSFVAQAFDDMAKLKLPHDHLFIFRFHLKFTTRQKIGWFTICTFPLNCHIHKK
jgi:hypothetical protein